MTREITARVPFAGTIEVAFNVPDDADDAALVDAAYEAAIATLDKVEWPYFNGPNAEAGDFGAVEVHKKLLEGNSFYGDCPAEVEIDSDEQIEDDQ